MRPVPQVAAMLVSLAAAATAPLGAEGYQETSVADGGEVKGRVYFEADYPPPETTRPDRDADTCGLKLPVERFVVDESSKGLANVVVSIEGIGRGKAFATIKPQLDQLKCRYTPRVLVVRPGQEFQVTNQDPILHNIHAYSGDDTVFNLAQPFQGQASAQSVAEEGVVRVTCDVHSWMEAWLLVIDSPYFAVSDAQGNFSITDVPPGEYSVRMWHELLGSAEKSVTVTEGGSSEVDFSIGG